jgi:hypothetical protein
MSAVPMCPECGADHEAAPDTFGVHRCAGCGVSFRPPGRVPIRRAGNSQVEPQSNSLSWIVAAAIGIGAATAIILGDRHAPAEPPSFEPIHVQIPPFQMPPFDPTMIEGLSPPGPVALIHEVHYSRIVAGRLQAGGRVRNVEARELLSVTLELRFIDVAAATLRTHGATVACRRIPADASCAWAVDAEIPAGMLRREGPSGGGEALSMVDFELVAWGQPQWIGDVFAPMELRAQFDAAGRPLESGDELELDLRERTIRVRVPEDVQVFEAWATLTSLDDEGQVQDVLETRFAEPLSGTRVLQLAVSPHESAGYDLRVGGSTMPAPTTLVIPE